MFNGKTIMITGGTGSFGTTVLNRLLHTDAKEIRIFSRDEKKQEDMRIALSNDKVRFFIGDVREYDSVAQAMTGVDYVVHAAGLKQIPSCEFFPMEAVRTNILGTENLLNAAIVNNVRRVVLLSIDKVVYPINAMGMSKALAEKILVAKSRSILEGGTIMCSTRYGNIMGSRGSVIPLFVSQLMAGEPLTLTDPQMTRFMMTPEDAVDLVLHAFEHANQGDLFVQKAPACTISDLGSALKELLKRDNPLRIIGTRHGEKLYESLVSREEMARAEDMGRYYRIPADNRDLNYKKYIVEGEQKISELDDYTSHNTQRLNIDEIKQLLSTLSLVRAAMN